MTLFTYEMAYLVLKDNIREEFHRHWYVYKSDVLFEDEKQKFLQIMEGRAGDGEYATALAFLSACLKKYHNKNVVILTDEYDVPLENAYFKGFYNRMIDFIRSLFESALKTNTNLEFGVITGCLRISRESIFTGLNNLKAVSILRDDAAEFFGFVPEEVEKMLKDYGMESRREEVRDWYDGYLFGDTQVCNPWSVINYVDENRNKKNILPKPYWSNTSSNSIVRELIEEALLSGDCTNMEMILKKQLTESISFYDAGEQFYHGFMVGMLGGLGAYHLKSNREAGEGRADLIMEPLDENDPVLIFELKKADKFSRMEEQCEAALRQIEEKHYDAWHKEMGYGHYVKYGIAFCKKSLRVKAVSEG